jgi:DnaD/phage-associated family protein
LCRSCNTSKGNRLDFNLTSSQTQDELEPNSSHVGTLIPDSLNLIPDSRNRRTDSCTVEEEVKEPKPNNKPDNNNGNKTTGNIYQAFSQNIHPITPMEHEALSEFIDEGMEEALVVWAIKQAVIHGKRSAKYITAILTNLQQEDINTLEAAEARERDREQDRLKQPGSSKARESPKLTAAEKANIETLNRQLEELTKGGSS